jgi:hypothetical protein
MKDMPAIIKKKLIASGAIGAVFFAVDHGDLLDKFCVGAIAGSACYLIMYLFGDHEL